MKKLILGCSLLFLIGCGENSVKFKDLKDGTSCTQIANLLGSLITCGEDEVQITNGADGKDGIDGMHGVDGIDGIDGRDGAMGLPGAKGDTGPKGPKGDAGVNGTNGVDGKDGTNGIDGKDGSAGPKGDKGDEGPQGKPGVVMVAHELPTRGTCVDLGGGVYAENEGNHADIYANDRCNHTSTNGVLCNDLHDGEGSGATGNELCWVGRRQFSIEGQYGDMKLYELSFN